MDLQIFSVGTGGWSLQMLPPNSVAAGLPPFPNKSVTNKDCCLSTVQIFELIIIQEKHVRLLGFTNIFPNSWHSAKHLTEYYATKHKPKYRCREHDHFGFSFQVHSNPQHHYDFPVSRIDRGDKSLWNGTLRH